MTSRAKRAEALFQQVCTLPPARRQRLLDDACGDDPELRSDVEGLLRSFDSAESGFLETPAASRVLRAGDRLNRYEIVDVIGEGGMGVVYRARDPRLGRSVAIKMLAPMAHTDPAPVERFLREARAASALNHPNICTVHDIGEVEGGPYLVLELLEGETLRSRLDAGRLDVSRLLDLAEQILSGLDAAHRAGIVHRDLKPANLFITHGGLAKILDFGLAKLVAPETSDDQITQSGLVAGTPLYMSPEQARGQNLDARTDLYSLGVVLYEMATGQVPIEGSTPATYFEALLNRSPRLVTDHDPSLPVDLARVIDRCLQKDPGRRHAGADDLLRELTAVRRSMERGADASSRGGISTTEAEHADTIDSIAVLPFQNDGATDDSEYLIDGITDALIDNLSRLPRLRVMARSTVVRFREHGDDPLVVGRELGVRAILTGRLRQRGDKLVIRAELVDSAHGGVLWGRRFDRTVAEILEIEDVLAREIAEHLRFELSHEEMQTLARRQTENAQAYEAYLKGRHAWARWKTPEGMRIAIGFFDQARSLDPLFALAFAGIADSYSVLGNIKALPSGEAYPTAKTAALQGLAIDDGWAELHTSLGFIQRMWDWDWDAAERSFTRAIELNPGYATAYRFYAGLLSGLGRHEEAITCVKQALRLDPLSPLLHTSVGDMFFYARRYEDAMVYYRKSIEMDPTLLAGHTDLARALELAGRYEEAIDEFRKAEALAPEGPPEPSSGLAHVYARMGRREDALAILDQIKALARTRYVSPYGIASVHACLGDVETALDWLERAFDAHDQTLALIKVHPRLDPLRSHPRFEALLTRMQLQCD